MLSVLSLKKKQEITLALRPLNKININFKALAVFFSQHLLVASTNILSFLSLFFCQDIYLFIVILCLTTQFLVCQVMHIRTGVLPLHPLKLNSFYVEKAFSLAAPLHIIQPETGTAPFFLVLDKENNFACIGSEKFPHSQLGMRFARWSTLVALFCALQRTLRPIRGYLNLTQKNSTWISMLS